MTELTDTQKAQLVAIAKEQFEELLSAHPEIKGMSTELVAAIFQAGLEAGCSSLIELAEL